MELTPKVFRDVQFREKLRGGYHPEDVDEFLEQAAQAVDTLHEQLRQATESAHRAQQAATEASATDEALKRVLLMAQRTADQAISEARQEADQLLAEARSKAESLLADAEERGRRAYESGLAEGRASMEKADEALIQARQEVEVLRGWVDEHKTHLLSVLRQAQSVVENAGLLSEPPTWAGQVTGASEAFETGDDFPAVADGGASPGTSQIDPSEDATGEWDPHYLQGLAIGAEAPQVDGALDGSAPDDRHDQGTDGAGAPIGEDGPRHSSGDPIALDERALDSFFSDQDMGEARGMGGSGAANDRARPPAGHILGVNGCCHHSEVGPVTW